MRIQHSLAPLGATLITAFFLFSSVLLLSEPAIAAEPVAPSGNGASSAPCACAEPGAKPDKPWPRPKYADLRSNLDETDRAAALEAVQVALTEVGDGASYVWYRRHGRLNGVVHPTSSFKDGAGKVCRHIVVVLAAGSYTKRTEGIACRTAAGVWQLEG